MLLHALLLFGCVCLCDCFVFASCLYWCWLCCALCLFVRGCFVRVCLIVVCVVVL